MAKKEQRRGEVVAVTGDALRVRIEQQSACAGCHVKDYCTSQDCRERTITLRKAPDEEFQKGDVVAVVAGEYTGLLAAFISFGLPLVLMLLTLILSRMWWRPSDTILVLIALISLACYYGLIYLLKPLISSWVKLEAKQVTKDTI